MDADDLTYRVCGAYESVYDEYTAPVSGRAAKKRCTLQLGHGGPSHQCAVEGTVLGEWPQ